jgi:translation initiation factor 1 (eIF-1/SUI1)
MKRKDFLKVSLSEENNVEVVVAKTVRADEKFIKRKIRAFQDDIEDLETELEKRLSTNTEIDSSTVENIYGRIRTLQTSIELYESFSKKYL